MNDVAVVDERPPIFQMEKSRAMEVLRNSLYPNAKPESVDLVLAYCQAANIDPMQKPVHIVPMWDKQSKSMRDTIMPSIGIYRIQAARTGQYAGVSEPEFGPEEPYPVPHPSWCKVTVKRALGNGYIAEFTAVEYWRENYATAGKDSLMPNTMWTKRAWGQLAKCAEAQALRKAFPEVGAQPTNDEMEGKDMFDIPKESPKAIAKPASLPDYTKEQFDKNMPLWEEYILGGNATEEGIIAKVSSRYVLSEEQKKAIRNITVVDAEFKPESNSPEFDGIETEVDNDHA